jgi:hypothetical protein
MPGGFPMLGSLANGTSINVDLSSLVSPTAITAPSNPNTKGSYSQLVASTAFDTVAILLTCNFAFVTGAGCRISADLAIGGAGSEQIIAADLFFSVPNDATSAGTVATLFLPLQIPAGTRVAMRYQSNTTSAQLLVSATLFDGGFTPRAQASSTQSASARVRPRGLHFRRGHQRRRGITVN